ncbi:MAG: hypothetical protein LBU23_02615 [Planctomycetota bacterium]|jgi:flagellar biosynthesis protein FlhF|nr:hypothetical protein [Planctomycetota bacterium]
MARRQNKTHVFRGRTCAEAMSKAKSKLGRDIAIVERRDVKPENLFSRLTSGRLGGGALEVELEVAVMEPNRADGSAPEARPRPANPLLHRTYAKALEGRERLNPEVAGAMAAAAPRPELGEAAAGIAGRLDALRKTLEKSVLENADKWDEIRALISLQARGGVPAVSPDLLASHRDMTARGIDEDLARAIVEDAQAAGFRSTGELEAGILRAAARRVPVAAPVLLRDDGPAVVALIGPSGMGKTTSLAKLAIHFGVKGRRSVGVVNEDLRRPGADGQLNNLGRMFGLAVATAAGPAEMRDAVRSLSKLDLILIDTSGRSPRDAGGIRELAEILRAAEVRETHLVLSGLASDDALAGLAERFRPAGFDRVILTKLDECLEYGHILNAASRLADGLSYVAHGPDYSTSIRPADGAWLAGLALGREEIGAGRPGGPVDDECGGRTA